MQRRSLSCIARVQTTSNSKVKKNKKKHTCSVIGLGHWANPLNGCKKNSIVLSPKIHAAENNEKKNCCMKIELSTVVKIMKNDQFCSAYVCVRCSFIVKGYECAVC